MKQVLLVFYIVFLQAGFILGQNKVDFGIFASSVPSQMEIRIKPNYTESGLCYLTNAQFTVKWPQSSGITFVETGIPLSPFLLTPQGPTHIYNGYCYQVWATAGGSNISWATNQQITIQTFSYYGPPCPTFEIAHDSYVINDSINGDYYIEINGNDLTGIVFMPTASQGLEAPGIISGADTVISGISNISYFVPPVPSAISYYWEYSGTGASLIGTGNSINISFAPNASSGNLTVKAYDSNCGFGPSSSPLAIKVLNDNSTHNNNSSQTKTNEISVYPNPANGNVIYLGIESTYYKEASIEVVNIISGIQKTLNLQLGSEINKNPMLDISGLESGIYIIRMKMNAEAYVGKLIKINQL